MLIGQEPVHASGMVTACRQQSLPTSKERRREGQNNTLFLFAGEQSADERGCMLMRQLHGFAMQGVGGPKMRSAGLDTILPMESFEVMGFFDVALHLPSLLRQFLQIRSHILQHQPACVVLIDYPDFNMRLAKSLKRGGYAGKIIQYVSPTVWAWRKNRIWDLARYFDLLLTLYPFEKKHYQATNLAVSYVGHPLVKECAPSSLPSNWPSRFNLTLFPGSRQSEIHLNFPLMLQTVEELLKQKDLSLAVSIANEKTKSLILKYLRNFPFRNRLFLSENTRALMQTSRCALATSGTITLELALFQVPTVVVYRLHFLNAFILKNILRIRLPHYCIVNIIAKKTIFPELIHTAFSPSLAAQELNKFLFDKSCQKKCVEECLKVKQALSLASGMSPSEAAAAQIEAIANSL